VPEPRKPSEGSAFPLLVELIGPAGSGKTSAAGAVAQRLQQKGLNILAHEDFRKEDLRRGGRYLQKSSALPRIVRILRLAAQRPVFAACVYLAGIMLGPPFGTRFYYGTRALGQLGMLVRLRREASFDVVLIDEGVVNILWSMTVGAPRLRGARLVRIALAAYARDSEARGVTMSCDGVRLAERAFSRSAPSRFSLHAGPDQRTDFPKWLGYHDELVAMLPKGFIVSSVDATQGPEDVQASLQRTLEKLIA
jgi:hypothetical protein